MNTRPAGVIRKNQEPYIYASSKSLDASVGSTNEISFPISSDHKFLLSGIKFVSETAVAGKIPRFELLLMRNDKQIFDSWVPCDMFNGFMYETQADPFDRYQVGNGEWYRFKKSYPFPQSSSMVVKLRNMVAAAVTVYIALDGVIERKP